MIAGFFMTQGVLQNTLAALGYILLNILPQPSPAASPMPVVTAQQELVHVVKDGDTMASLAEKYYGSSDYWTTLWNDNPLIVDPAVLPIEAKLKISTQKPLLVDTGDARRMRRVMNIKQELPIQLASEATQPRVAGFSATADQVAIPTPTAIPTQAAIAVYNGGSLNTEQINFLGMCESGMNPSTNTGNGYYGAFQFSYQTWQNMATGYERADIAPLDVQISAVQQLLSRSSIFTQFPGCANKMRSIGMI